MIKTTALTLCFCARDLKPIFWECIFSALIPCLHVPLCRVKPSVLALAASSACFLYCSSRTKTRRKMARQRWRGIHNHHLLQQRAAKTETAGDKYYLESIRILYRLPVRVWRTGVYGNLVEPHTVQSLSQHFTLKAQSNYQRYSGEDFRYYLIVDFKPKHTLLTCLLTRDGWFIGLLLLYLVTP